MLCKTHGMTNFYVTESRTRCKQCVIDGQRRRLLEPPAPCTIHPYNTERASNGTDCKCCRKEEKMCINAVEEDELRGGSSMTPSYIRTYLGTRCPISGIVLWTLPGWNPNGLSMHRIDSTLAHNNDNNQTIAVTLQCNLLIGPGSIGTVIRRLLSAHRFMLDNFKHDNSIVPQWPIRMPYNRHSGSRDYVKVILHNKRTNSEFSLIDYNFVYNQYVNIQHGACSACNLPLIEGDTLDISFDRKISSEAYTPENVTLMHRYCNVGINVWSKEVFYETAKCTYEYQNR